MDARILGELERFDADVPLEEAWAIPKTWYVDPAFLELEREAVFDRTWQYVGAADAVSQPGQYMTAEVSGEPIVVVRGEDGVLRAMSNVCRHRGGPLALCDRGTASVLRCAYHGWTYSLSGELKGTPDLEGVRRFDRSDVRLPQIVVAVRGPFVFVTLHPGAPLADSWWPYVQGLGAGSLRFARRQTYEVDCNWKVYMDNYLDGGYHVPHIHPDLMSVLDYRNYRCETHDGWNVQVSPFASSRGERDGYARQGNTAWYLWAYPNFTVNLYQGFMDINLVLPLGVDRTAVIFDYFVQPDADESIIDSSIQVSERIQEEDRLICEAVQHRLSSRWYDRGRFSVRRENGGHQFHVMLGRALQAHVKVPGATCSR